MKKNWITKNIDQSIVEYNSKFLNISKPVSSILYARGYKTPQDIDNFLNPRISSLNSPFQMKGMHEAISRIRKAISDDEKIGIFSDSDIDGLTSLKILHKLFNKLGNHIFIRYLKDYETYGLTKEIIDEFIDPICQHDEDITYLKRQGTVVNIKMQFDTHGTGQIGFFFIYANPMIASQLFEIIVA